MFICEYLGVDWYYDNGTFTVYGPCGGIADVAEQDVPEFVRKVAVAQSLELDEVDEPDFWDEVGYNDLD